MKFFFQWSILLLFWPGIGNAGKFILKSSEGEQEVIPFSTYHYVSFDLTSPADFTLVSGIKIESAEIEPASLRIPFSNHGNSITFRLDKPCYFMLRLNDSVKIFVFAEKTEKIPSGEIVVDFSKRYQTDPTGKLNQTMKIQQALDDISGSGKILYFPPGKYLSGQLHIKSNTRIFLTRGAEIMADTTSITTFLPDDEVKTRRFIYIGSARNVEIRGYGTLCGNGRILRAKYGDDARMRLILAARSEDILIEGITLKDPGSWNTHLLLCSDLVVRGVKLLNDTEISNTDGFDPDASKKVLIRNCFACCGDDNVAVKTTGNSGLLGDVSRVTVKGCVFLTKKSALKIGTETLGQTMQKITFENNEVLECDRGISVYVSDGARLDQVRYLNNRFGRNFPDQQRKCIHITVNKRKPESRLGSIHHLLIRNCTFDHPFPRKSMIRYGGNGVGINGMIRGLRFGNLKITSATTGDFDIINSNIRFR